MDWALVAVFLWSAGQPPIIQIPIETKGLCEIAADHIKTSFSVSNLGDTLGTLGARVTWPEGGGVFATCVRVAENGHRAERLRYNPETGRLE